MQCGPDQSILQPVCHEPSRQYPTSSCQIHRTSRGGRRWNGSRYEACRRGTPVPEDLLPHIKDFVFITADMHKVHAQKIKSILSSLYRRDHRAGRLSGFHIARGEEVMPCIEYLHDVIAARFCANCGNYVSFPTWSPILRRWRCFEDLPPRWYCSCSDNYETEEEEEAELVNFN